MHDYINIGLAYRSRNEGRDAVRLLEETLLRPFLQVGVSLTLQLQQRAVALAKTLQQQVGEQWEAVLDSPFRETYAGVRRHPPMFFRGLDTAGEIFLRRFQNLAEIERVETVLNHTPLWFAVLSRWQLLSEYRAATEDSPASLATLWNTAFVRWELEGQVAAQPLKRAELLAFQKRRQRISTQNSMRTVLVLCLHRAVVVR